MSDFKPPPLDEIDLRVLDVLSEEGGFCTRDVGFWAKLPTGRKHSAILSTRIRYLEKHGLVGRLDGNSPVAWVRTPNGTKCVGLFSPTPSAPLPETGGVS